MRVDCDISIVGGGPAGLATAGLLAAAGVRVVVLERASKRRRPVGETLGPEVGPLLKRLGAFSVLSDVLLDQVPCRSVLSAWGSDELAERSSLLNPLGEGWHVDRARFDEALAGWAMDQGARRLLAEGPLRVWQEGGAVGVDGDSGVTLRGRCLIDASGRGAPGLAGARSSLGRWFAWDRQVAIVGRMEPTGAPPRTELLVEALEEGWWYTAPQPDGSLVATWVTDSDMLPKSGRRGLAVHYERALGRTRHTAALCRGRRSTEPLRVVRADSGCAPSNVGDGVLSVGDARMATDPLGGMGVARALTDALALASRWTGAESERDRGRDDAWEAYLASRSRVYGAETRWPEAPFWARRRECDGLEGGVWLPPDARLSWRGSAPAEAETLIPPMALRALQSLLRKETPAHKALRLLEATSPGSLRRSLLGLQLLVRAGAVNASAASGSSRTLGMDAGSDAL